MVLNEASEVIEDPDAVGARATYYPGVTMFREATPLTVGMSRNERRELRAQLSEWRVSAAWSSAPTGRRPAGHRCCWSQRTSWDCLAPRYPDASTETATSKSTACHPAATRCTRCRDVAGETAKPADCRERTDITDLTMLLGTAPRSAARSPSTASRCWTRRPRAAASHHEPAQPTGLGQRGRSMQRSSGWPFVLGDIGGGARLIRVNRLPDDLQLKAVYVEGRNVIDTPRDFAAGQTISGVSLVLTDQVTELTGWCTTIAAMR